MKFVELEIYAEKGTKNVLINLANIFMIDGDYLYFTNAERPIQLTSDGLNALLENLRQVNS